MTRFARFGFGAVMTFGVVAVCSLPAWADKDKDKDDGNRRGGAPQAAAQDGGSASTPTTARGANFLVKTQLDPNFCMAVGTGTNEGRTVTLQQCTGVDTQRFAFSLNADDTNVIIESQGMCLDGRTRKGGDGLAIPVAKCKFNDAWRFSMTASGLIKDERSGKCLGVPGAASNAAVSLVACDETKKGQLWKLAH